MRKILPLLLVAAAVAVAGCGSKYSMVSVMGKTLSVKEQNFGRADRFCDTLANGEFMVVLSDFPACDALKVDGGVKQAFHSSDETNLRIVFPSAFTKIPHINSFVVGPTNSCGGTVSGANTQAIVMFSHNPAGAAAYDLNIQADSGTVTVSDYNGTDVLMASELKGSIDVMIGGAHVQQSFDATLCNGIVPGAGN